MTEQDKQLLLKDLCARLPYGVIVDNPNPAGGMWDEVINIDTSTKTVTLLYDGRVFSIDDVKPYLRPMSSMTEEETEKWFDAIHHYGKDGNPCLTHIDSYDWLNAHHFDYRGLIHMGLALEAPKGMYESKNNI